MCAIATIRSYSLENKYHKIDALRSIIKSSCVTNRLLILFCFAREVSMHTAAVDELKKEHESRIEKLQTERAMVEVMGKRCVLY